MLKRVRTADVELGMFVHKLEGSWFKHPFWRSKFLLEDGDMLADLHASEVDWVVIDIAKGLDVRPVGREPAPARPAAAPAAPVRSMASAVPQRRRSFGEAPPVDLRSTAPQPLRREFGLAKTVAGNSQKVISRIFIESRLGKAIDPDKVEPVISDVFSSIQRNPHAFNGLMRCKRENEYIYRHALAVSAMMISLARQMQMEPEMIRQAGMAGLLMDVGIGHLPVDLGEYGGDYRNLPQHILEQHVQLGYNFLAAGGEIPDPVLNVCLNHHELLDGSGYPNKLKGEQIDLLSRMAAICDTYDAMVSDTASGAGMDPAAAMQQLSSMHGMFDPVIIQKFIDTMGVYPVGSVVLLRTGRLAMVVDQDAADAARPRVRTFFDTKSMRNIKAEDIALASCYGADEIVRTATPDEFGISDFAALRERIYTAAAKDDGFTF